MSLFGAIADLAKHAHDQTVGRVMDVGQSMYMTSKAQRRQAELNRDLWQYQMSNAYQLTTEDMRKAGINPMVAFSQGATSAPGHATSAGAVTMQHQDNWLPSQSIVNAKTAKNIDADTGVKNAEQQLIRSKTVESQAQAKLIQENVFTQKMENALRQYNLPVQEQEALLKKAQVMFERDNFWLYQAKRYANTAKDVVDVVPINRLVDKILGIFKDKGKLPKSSPAPSSNTKKGSLSISKDYFSESN